MGLDEVKCLDGPMPVYLDLAVIPPNELLNQLWQRAVILLCHRRLCWGGKTIRTRWDGAWNFTTSTCFFLVRRNLGENETNCTWYLRTGRNFIVCRSRDMVGSDDEMMKPGVKKSPVLSKRLDFQTKYPYLHTDEENNSETRWIHLYSAGFHLLLI